jgi:hypothetical protein
MNALFLDCETPKVPASRYQTSPFEQENQHSLLMIRKTITDAKFQTNIKIHSFINHHLTVENTMFKVLDI